MTSAHRSRQNSVTSPLTTSQAAESLCMNGRALNEKAIEVSPSSSRVLDRAAEIITPFPPSKNRPRPGDWTCPQCGFSNFQRRTACFRCSYPTGSAVPGADPMNYGNYGYGPPHMMPPHHHHMSHHGGHAMGHGRGGGGGVVPFRAGDWKCGSEGCGYHNFAKNVTCLRCGASRAGAAVVADSAFPSPHDPPSTYGMGPPSMGGTHGAGPFGGPSGGFGAGPFAAQGYGGPPSQYALPSGLGAPTGAYPPMGASFGQGGPFDSRAAEAAFTAAGNGPPPTSGGMNGSSAFGGNAYGPSSMDGSNTDDSFAFLQKGFGDLSVNEGNRRNGANSTKSPS